MELACVSSYVVTHHCVHQEGDSLSQHMVVFGRHFGPAEEPVQLVQGGHLVREARLACQRRKERRNTCSVLTSLFFRSDLFARRRAGIGLPSGSST